MKYVIRTPDPAAAGLIRDEFLIWFRLQRHNAETRRKMAQQARRKIPEREALAEATAWAEAVDFLAEVEFQPCS